jgi:hypothetical protein
MGGLDCEVDVVESVDTAVEAEGAVESAEVVVEWFVVAEHTWPDGQRRQWEQGHD